MKYLSIIVPVYNVEKYIRECIGSIFCQGLEDEFFEVIIVNDGSKDNSIDLISDYNNQHSNIQIVDQENQGLSEARNNGLRKATGEYVLFLDSDDLLVKGSLKSLMDCMINSMADMAMANFVKLNDDQIDSFVHKVVPVSSANPIEMKGEEALVKFFNPRECFVWRTIYRRQFLLDSGIKFIPGIYFEDVPFTTECYLKAKKCISLPIPFYIYRQRPNSIVSSVNKKKVSDFNVIIEYLWHLKEKLSMTDSQLLKLNDTIFVTFSVEMWYLTSEKEVYTFRKEIVRDLKKRVPDLRFINGRKQRLTSFLFKYVPYQYLWLRSVS